MHRIFLKWLIFIVIVINLMIVAVVILDQNPAAHRAMPVPNGYDDFLKAGTTVVAPPNDLDQLTLDQLNRYVAANAEPLKLVRVGLARQVAVPIEYSLAWTEQHMTSLSSMKGLHRAFVAEAKLAELQGRTNDAARAFIDSIRFAQEIVRGGLLIDGLVGLACEKYGATGLAQLADHLNPATCRDVSSELKQINSNRARATDVEAQERDWARSAGGLRGRLLRIIWFFTGDPTKPALQKYFAQDQAVQAHLQEVIKNLQSRAGGQE